MLTFNLSSYQPIFFLLITLMPVSLFALTHFLYTKVCGNLDQDGPMDRSGYRWGYFLGLLRVLSSSILLFYVLWLGVTIQVTGVQGLPYWLENSTFLATGLYLLLSGLVGVWILNRQRIGWWLELVGVALMALMTLQAGAAIWSTIAVTLGYAGITLNYLQPRWHRLKGGMDLTWRTQPVPSRWQSVGRLVD
ncbi:hypothetical protein [Magnetococcus sp. PR-3]|uniref:hypothetical protein n=1 Tax=Magnetococcus sp. PR-3 TaxID=3120355 RepID=UPI002FCE525F